MTSSLVGSEMCIRDRAEPELEMVLVASFVDLRTATSGSKHDKAVEDLETVSYTHLTLPTICSV
eukprot:7176399-Prorocentrum_lima.AAC.1